MNARKTLLFAGCFSLCLLLPLAGRAQNTYTCDGCTISGTYVNAAGKIFNVATAFDSLLSGGNAEFVNQGSVLQNGSGNFRFGNFNQNANFINDAGAIYQFATDSSILNNAPGNDIVVFSNQGLVWKSAGTGTSAISVLFDNLGGQVQVDSGTLSLNGGGTSSNGVFTIASGALLDLTGEGNPTWAGTMTGGGFGVVSLASGALTASPNLTLGFTNEVFQWNGGTVQGAITNTGIVTISGPNVSTLTGANTIFDNLGTVKQVGQGGLLMGDFGANVSFINGSAATYQFASDSSIAFGLNATGQGPSPFTNYGIVWKSGGTNTSSIGLAFDNQGGVLRVDSGTLSFNGGGSSFNGAFVVAAGAVCDLTGGSSPTWSGVMTGAGSGQVWLHTGVISATPSLLLAFPANLFQWNGGTLQGTITNALTVTISGPDPSTLTGPNTIFDNRGTVEQIGTGGTVMGDYGANVYFINEAGATYKFDSDSSVASGFTATGQGSAPFTNYGTIWKSGGTNTSAISLAFYNQGGSIEVDSGVLSLNGGYTQKGGNLTIGISGLAAGQSGMLEVTGTANLNGPLNIVLAQGYVPPKGAQFQILSAASYRGEFSALNAPEGFQVGYNSGYPLVTFTGAPTYEIAASQNPPSGGSVANSGLFIVGTTNLLTALPAYGYAFKDWTLDGRSISVQPVLTNIVEDNRTYVANYTATNLVHLVTLTASPLAATSVNLLGAGVYTNTQTANISAPLTVTSAPYLFTFNSFSLNGVNIGTSNSLTKTFSTTDPPALQYVAHYSIRSIDPVVVNVSANIPAPIPATSDLVLQILFDRAMNSSILPTVLLTNKSPGAAQPVAPANGSWSTTFNPNDTYVTPPITIGQGMDGKVQVFVSSATDILGNQMVSTNATNFLVSVGSSVNKLGFTTLHNFDDIDGSEPFGTLALSGSTLYGTTDHGGHSSDGTVFSLNTNGTGFTSLHSFLGRDGAYPQSGLVVSGQTLYGTTFAGGKDNYGTLFAINNDGSGFVTLYSFTNGIDGANPNGSLLLSGDTLYGTAYSGGRAEDGSVFSINRDGSGFTVLYNFTNGTDGGAPCVGLILSGKTLYGTTLLGKGTVFSINTNGAAFNTLYTFDSYSGVFAGLMLAGSTLYGTTELSGSFGDGSVFALNTNGSAFTNLHSFSGPDGGAPSAGLILSGDILFGTTEFGGDANDGAVFALNTNGTGFTNLYIFDQSDGYQPVFAVTLAGDTLYGSTIAGGANNDGTVFSLSAPTNTAGPPVFTTPPSIAVTTPADGTSFLARQPVPVNVSASSPDGISQLALFVSGVLYPSGSVVTKPPVIQTGSDTLSTSLANLAKGSYLLTVVATDLNGLSSTNVSYITVDMPGASLINFDVLDTSGGAVGGVDLSNYLAGFGVGLTNVTLGTRLEADKGADLSRGAAAVPSSPPNLFTQVGLSQPAPVSFTLTFATPVEGLAFTRAGLTPGQTLALHLAWTAYALDASGTELESVSEPLLPVTTNAIAPRLFELAAPQISAVRFDSDPFGAASFAAVLLDDLVLESNAPANSLSIALSAPPHLTAPADIRLTAAAGAGNGAVDHVNFYLGPTLLGVASNTPYRAVFSGALPGIYTFTAQVVDTNGYAKTSPPAQVNVGVGPNSTNLNFDTLAAPAAGAALDAYFSSFSISATNLTPGTSLSVLSEASLYGGGLQFSTPPTNVLTQTGASGPVSFTLVFTNLLTQFSFTRPELTAAPTVSHPAWQAQAYDALGVPQGQASEGLITSSSNVAAATYTLTGGNGIRRVTFTSQGNGFTTFNALLLENLVLTTSPGALPPAIVLTNPLAGQVYAEPGTVPLAAAALDATGITGVSFYANGVPIGAAAASPYAIQWTNLTDGTFALTAVATNNAGLSWTSPPVNISVVPGSGVFGILQQPVGQIIGLGSNMQFNVTASGSKLSYQWYLNGAPDPDQTSNLLVIAQAGRDDIGRYAVVISSGGLSITSQVASLNVLPLPGITAQTPSESVPNGSVVNLSVLATHALSYQWNLNGARIPGATNASYGITNAQPLNSGSYSVIVANTIGSAQSSLVQLIVATSGSSPSADDFANRVSINPLSGPVTGNNVNATAEVGEPLHDGKPGGKSIWYTWQAGFTGEISLTTQGSTFDTLLAVYTGSDVTQLTPVAADDDDGGFFTSLVTFDCIAGVNYQIAVDGFRGASGTVVLGLPPGTGYRVLNPAAGDDIPAITQAPVNQVALAGSTVRLIVSAVSASPITYQWYFQNAPIAGAHRSQIVIPNVQADDVGNYAVLAANDAGSILSSSANLQVLQTNSLGAPSSSAQDKFGDAVDLSPDASGDSAARRQDNGGDVRGFSVAQTFSTIGATKEQGEPNPDGQTGGSSAWYIYTTPAAGTLHLDSGGSAFNTILAAYTNAGPGAVTFASLAEAASGFTTNYLAQGQPSLNLPGVPAGQTFYIVVDGYNGASGKAHLNIGLGTPPIISRQPQTRPAVPGETVAFSVAATGTTNLSYQWQLNSASLPGATAATYSVSNAQAASVGSYTVLVSNVVAVVTSTPAILTLQNSPFILAQPENQIIPPGLPATFSVTADGLAPLSYKWYFKGAPLSAATASTLNLAAVKPANGGQYSVVIANSSGSVTSAPAVLVVGTEVRPLVAIASPANHFTTTSPSVTVKGTASAKAGIAQVQLTLNGLPLGPAAGTTAWSATIALSPGTNLLTATSIDLNGFASTPVTHSLFYVVTSKLTLLTSGPGKITGALGGSFLRVGQGYTVTGVPTPASGFLFSNWTGSDAAGNLGLLSESPALNFIMTSNLVLQANFGLNPFTNVAGSYNALFPAANTEVSETNSGFIALTLTASQGAYSAHLLLDGGSYAFTGVFDLTGNSSTIIHRAGKLPVTVSLHLNLAVRAPINPLTGAVATSDWSSAIYGEKAFFNAQTQPATAYAGKYTLVLPPGAGGSETMPGGYGAITITNNPGGTVTLAGHLADGAPVSQSVAISKDGNVPVYVPLYSGQGSLWGWLNFSYTAGNVPPQTLTGSFSWIKNPGPVRTSYPDGFTIQTNVLASVYDPAESLPPLNDTLTIGQAGQGNPLVYHNISFINGKLVNNAAAANPTNALSAAINSTTGTISLTFRPTGAKASIGANGVILQTSPINAAGWFQTATPSGYFLLEP